jgi:hypothetical protein
MRRAETTARALTRSGRLSCSLAILVTQGVRDLLVQNLADGQCLNLATFLAPEPINFEKCVAGEFEADEIAEHSFFAHHDGFKGIEIESRSIYVAPVEVINLPSFFRSCAQKSVSPASCACMRLLTLKTPLMTAVGTT